MTPSSGKFDPAFALGTMLPLADLAYGPTRGTLPAGFHMVGPILVEADLAAFALRGNASAVRMLHSAVKEAGSPFGFVALSPETDTLVVSFRGTETADEWAEDFDALAVACDGAPKGNLNILVHQGFQLVYRTLHESLMGLIRTAGPGIKAVWITGHSLGAALATFSAPYILQSVRPAASQVCTFAGPRVGSLGYSGFFTSWVPLCYRIVNQWDIVPNVPLPPLYEHVGIEIRVNGGFTPLLKVAHSLDDSYAPGLKKLLAG